MTRIRAALVYRDMTVTDLHYLIAQGGHRISTTNLRRWASGEYKPKLSSIAPLCRGLRVSADWLVGLTDEIEPGVVYTGAEGGARE